MTTTKEYNAKYQKARQRAHRALAKEYPQRFEELLQSELQVEGIERRNGTRQEK